MWSNKAEKKAKRGGATDAAMDAYLELADKVFTKLLLIKLLQSNFAPGYHTLKPLLCALHSSVGLVSTPYDILKLGADAWVHGGNMPLQPRHLRVTVIGAMNTASVLLYGSNILRSTVMLGGFL